MTQRSSPRTRGLSGGRARWHHDPAVVPAHAGVIRCAPRTARTPRRRPRARGGYPEFITTVLDGGKSSPRTRGLSVRLRGDARLSRVVPAHAGVIRTRGPDTGRHGRRPRARGGYPASEVIDRGEPASSPRTRGLSGRQPVLDVPGLVVPAHAGVVRRAAGPTTGATSRPRARGGYPNGKTLIAAGIGSSPRTRGLSVRVVALEVDRVVVPAHAGVIRWSPAGPACCGGRPRARGGLPASILGEASMPTSSPRRCGVLRRCPRTGSSTSRRPRALGKFSGGKARCHVDHSVSSTTWACSH